MKDSFFLAIWCCLWSFLAGMLAALGLVDRDWWVVLPILLAVAMCVFGIIGESAETRDATGKL